MLKKEVIEAVKENKFKIWAVDTIDDGIEILTGIRSGSIKEEGSINWLINKTLNDYAELLKEFSEDEEPDKEPNTSHHWVSDIVMK